AATPGAAHTPPRVALAQQASATRWYSVFGLLVRSEIALPIAPTAEPRGQVADLSFVRGGTGQPLPEPDGPLVAALPCPVHGVDLSMFRGPGGTWMTSRLGWVCR